MGLHPEERTKCRLLRTCEGAKLLLQGFPWSMNVLATGAPGTAESKESLGWEGSNVMHEDSWEFSDESGAQEVKGVTHCAPAVWSCGAVCLL